MRHGRVTLFKTFPPPQICGYNRNADKATSFLKCYTMPTG